MKDLYDAAEAAREMLLSRKLRLIDSAMEIRRVQRMTPAGWETTHFLLYLIDYPHVWLRTPDQILVLDCGDELILNLSDEEVEIAREIHDYLERW
ncbi:hypothetical protein [Archaeoglobus sp.]|uniref:hypothetical protein n=1 Tax=Archaeoglobus sp. TaxID=1872626 RepID=UPI0024AC46A9|nr:hypothetical protein [Archaeoglobus sp.]MDI3497042.1 hypothetical protein [Archaeoglobus sp.]